MPGPGRTAAETGPSGGPSNVPAGQPNLRASDPAGTPWTPADESAVEDRLSTPSAGLIADAGRLEGDVLVLGAGGKMGPSLARLARRALDAAGRSDLRVIAVSRWSDRGLERQLRDQGIETQTFDLAPDADLSRLPDAAHVVFMVGTKFGSATRSAQTWATNTVVPALVARRYAGASITAFSTGNVYPLVPVESGGAREDDPPDPVGEYAMTCLGRERVLEYASQAYGTRVSVLRLNYAVEMRYGVLADIGTRVRDGHPVDLATGHANVVWQGYANEVALRLLTRASTPPYVLNVTGPETLDVAAVAARFGAAFGSEPRLRGEPEPTALLSDASRCHQLFGLPEPGLDALIDAEAEWLRNGRTVWDRPTKFERRDGRF